MTTVLKKPEPPQREVPAASEPTPRVNEQRWRMVLPVLLVIGFAVHVAWRLWLIRYVPTVIAHADEDRYLLSARALAGGPGGYGNDTEAFRRLGYPILLVPIYSYFQDPFRVYHAAQVIGILINALTFPLAYLFARRVLSTGVRLSLVMAFLAAALPAVVYYSEFALTDVLFAPIGLTWLLLVHGWIANRSQTWRLVAALGAGAVVGYAYVVHVRGLVMLSVHLGLVLVMLIAHTKPKRGRFVDPIASALVALAITQLDWLMKQALGDRLEHGGIEPGNHMLSTFTSALGLVRTLTDTSGQFWYLAIATGGVGLVGVIVAIRTLRAHGDFVRRTMFGTILVTTVLIALSSASALPVDARVSNHAYFRYIAFLAPVWLMIGMWALIQAEARARFKLIASTAAVLGVTLFVLLARMSPGEWIHPFDSPEVAFLTFSWNDFRPFDASVVTLAMLALWMARRWLVPTSVLLAYCLVGIVMINAKSVQPLVEKEYIAGSRLVQDVGLMPGDVVESAKQVDLGSRLNHQREVYWAQIPEFDLEGGQPSRNATVVIAPWYPDPPDPNAKVWHWDGAGEGFTRIYTYKNDDRRWAVWRRDG